MRPRFLSSTVRTMERTGTTRQATHSQQPSPRPTRREQNVTAGQAHQDRSGGCVCEAEPGCINRAHSSQEAAAGAPHDTLPLDILAAIDPQHPRVHAAVNAVEAYVERSLHQQTRHLRRGRGLTDLQACRDLAYQRADVAIRARDAAAVAASLQPVYRGHDWPF